MQWTDLGGYERMQFKVGLLYSGTAFESQLYM